MIEGICVCRVFVCDARTFYACSYSFVVLIASHLSEEMKKLATLDRALQRNFSSLAIYHDRSMKMNMMMMLLLLSARGN